MFFKIKKSLSRLSLRVHPKSICEGGFKVALQCLKSYLLKYVVSGSSFQNALLFEWLGKSVSLCVCVCLCVRASVFACARVRVCFQVISLRLFPRLWQLIWHFTWADHMSNGYNYPNLIIVVIIKCWMLSFFVYSFLIFYKMQDERAFILCLVVDSKPWGFFLYLLLCQFYAWISVVFFETNSQTNLLPTKYKLTYIRHMLFASQIYTIWSILIKPKTIGYLVYIKCFCYNSACAGAFKLIVNLKVWLFWFWLSFWEKKVHKFWCCFMWRATWSWFASLWSLHLLPLDPVPKGYTAYRFAWDSQWNAILSVLNI